MSEREELPTAFMREVKEPFLHPVICNKWDEGAFPVYRRQPAAPVQVTDEMVERADEAYHKTVGGMLDGRPMKNALAAALQAGVPSGWKLVPEEPTQEMLAAFLRVKHWQETTPEGLAYFVNAARAKADGEPFYKAMLATAPAPGEGTIAPCKTCGDTTVICRRLDQPDCPRKAVAQAPGEGR